MGWKASAIVGAFFIKNVTFYSCVVLYVVELPVIELTIDDILEDRVEAIAFVDNPAIQRNWMAFDSHKEYKFQTADEEKRIVAGPLMVADMPIYRNYNGKEFFVKFSAQTIEQIVNKFMKEGRVNAFNFMHNEEQKLEGVYVQQSFIINTEMGINTPSGFDELANGSWFGFIKVDNDSVWNDYVKTGKLKGFSVEGNFSEKNKFTSNIMSKVEAFLEKLAAKFGLTEEEQEKTYASKTLAGGGVVKYEGELAEGSAVFAEDGQPMADGEHTCEDGTVFACEGGIVSVVKKPEDTPKKEEMSKESVLKTIGEFADDGSGVDVAALARVVKFIVNDMYSYLIREQEREAAMKQLQSDIQAFSESKPVDYAEKFAAIEKENVELKETQKLLFETIQAMQEKSDPEAVKDKFRRAETAGLNLGERAKAFLENNKK